MDAQTDMDHRSVGVQLYSSLKRKNSAIMINIYTRVTGDLIQYLSPVAVMLLIKEEIQTLSKVVVVAATKARTARVAVAIVVASINSSSSGSCRSCST